MAKYKVIGEQDSHIEINGVVRRGGDVLTEKDFGKHPELTKAQKAQREADGETDAPPDELESLLATGHVKKIK
jgi:hypothetical protein